MSVAAPGVDDALRQGDVCAVPDLPIWNLRKSGQVTGFAGEGMVLPSWDRAQRSGDHYLIAVCSQCCDLENPRARTGVAVAPLMKVPSRAGDDRYERIMASGQVDVLGRYEFVNLFPLRLDVDGATLDLVVDFSALISIAPAVDAVAHLLSHRRSQMGDADRVLFREKLGFMFGRDPDAAAPSDPS